MAFIKALLRYDVLIRYPTLGTGCLLDAFLEQTHLENAVVQSSNRQGQGLELTYSGPP